MNNPLVIPILSLLQAGDSAGKKPVWTLLELLSEIEKTGIDWPVNGSAQQVIFQKNFLLMNALVQLQETLMEQGWVLNVSVMAIHLSKLSETTQTLPSESLSLREYYLDWRNFTDTSTEDVERLLTQFWDKYLAADQQLEAYTVLSLEMDASFDEVKSRYRELAAKYHPDRGGDSGQFMAVRRAYELIKKVSAA